MASIRHRTTSKGAVMWQVRYRDNDISRSETFKTREAAETFKRLVDDLGHAEALTILREREGNTSHTPNVRDWCTEHIDTLTGVTNGTRDRYRRVVATKLGSLAHLPIDAVTPASIARWVNALEARGMSGKTIANHHGFLSAAFKSAVRAGLIPANPCEGTRIPKTERQEMVFLTHDEFTILLSHIRPDAQPMVACMPATGLRFGEITALQVRDIDLEHGSLTVSRSWKYTENSEMVLGAPKTKRSRRTIYVPGQVVDILRDACAGKTPEAFVFTNQAGSPWTRSRFHEGVWQPAVRAAQPQLRKKPRVHDMRHTCAAWLLRAGASMYTVQKYLGHESYSTTANVYAHMEPAEMRRAADAMTAAIGGAVPAIEP
ncbi:tyrosine-type recombinase/integrase [Cellulosimicrobium cellulans]|uniref:tyrosine-type recombinase/integrase n=1 Tax=Cellulosimicrobium cellulans TaxID=1710 RepID=UPI003C373E57